MQTATVRAVLGDAAEARGGLARAESSLPLADDWLGLRASRQLAVAAILDAERAPSAADAHFEEAIRAFEAVRLPWIKVRAQRLYQHVLRRRGDSARHPEIEAALRTTLSNLGAGPGWVSAATTAYVTPRTLPRDPRDVLTNREGEVAQLVAGNDEPPDCRDVGAQPLDRDTAHLQRLGEDELLESR